MQIASNKKRHCSNFRALVECCHEMSAAKLTKKDRRSTASSSIGFAARKNDDAQPVQLTTAVAVNRIGQ